MNPTGPGGGWGGSLGSFWCSTRPSADKGTDYNLHHALKSVERPDRSEGSERSTVYSALCILLSVPMSTKGRVEQQTEPKRPPPCGRLGSF